MKNIHHLIEALEPRIVPAAIFSFIDVDGDLVKITSSKGTSADLESAVKLVEGQLQMLDLSSPVFGGEFAGADVSIISSQQAGGDGHVNVGFLNAEGIALGKVTVDGDLGRLVAGVADKPGTSVKSLSVGSMGLFGVGTQAAGGSLLSVLKGSIGKLSISGDLRDATFLVSNIGGFKANSVFIGGDLDRAQLVVDGGAGTVKIGGSVLGGDDFGAGSVTFTSGVDNFSVGGCIHGGQGVFTGVVRVNGKSGTLKVGGSVIGGTGANSGAVSISDMASVAIGGSLVGGDAGSSGNISGLGNAGKLTIGGDVQGGSRDSSGSIFLKEVGSMVIGGSIVGGTNTRAGSVLISSVDSLVVKGSLIGGTTNVSGIISCSSIGSIKVGGDLDTTVHADLVSNSGTITANSIGSVTIGGSLLTGNPLLSGNQNSSIIATATIGSVNILGSVKGGEVGSPVISARTSIDKINIAGTVDHAQILVGFSGSDPVNGEAQLGSIAVGSWHDSDLSVGVGAGSDNKFGTLDDVAPAASDPALIAKIASLTIRNQAIIDTDSAIVAGQIGKAKIATVKLAFDPAKIDRFEFNAANKSNAKLVIAEVA